MRDLASNIPTRMLVEWSRGTEKEKNITVIRKISKSLKEIEIIFEKNDENHQIEKMRTILIFRTVSKCCFLVFILMQLQFQFFHFRNNFSLMSGILTSGQQIFMNPNIQILNAQIYLRGFSLPSFFHAPPQFNCGSSTISFLSH